MSYFIQRVGLVFVWKLFPFVLWIIITIAYYEWYVLLNLPFNY